MSDRSKALNGFMAFAGVMLILVAVLGGTRTHQGEVDQYSPVVYRQPTGGTFLPTLTLVKAGEFLEGLTPMTITDGGSGPAKAYFMIGDGTKIPIGTRMRIHKMQPRLEGKHREVVEYGQAIWFVEPILPPLKEEDNIGP